MFISDDEKQGLRMKKDGNRFPVQKHVSAVLAMVCECIVGLIILVLHGLCSGTYQLIILMYNSAIGT